MGKILAVVTWALIVGSTPAFARLAWCWHILGTGVSAAGTFTTDDHADAEGFYRITGIAGTANSAHVTALQPAGTAIPGNSGFPVDNLVRAVAPQLTTHGFGFMASDGAYHNPFYMEKYRDYISRPPYPDGKGKEPTIQFRAASVMGGHCPSD